MSTLSERFNVAWAELLKRCPDATKSQLASACGVRAPSVSDWFSGETKSLKSSTANRAASFLGVSVTWLSDGIGTMTAEPTNDRSTREISTDHSIHGGTETSHAKKVGAAHNFTPVDASGSPNDTLPRQSIRPTNDLRRFPVLEWTDSPRYKSATPASHETLPDDPAFSPTCFALVMPDGSMQMTIPRGNTLLIDPERALEHEGAYLFDGPAGPIVRRVRRGVAGWMLLEEDGRNSPAEPLHDTLKVIGRVVMSVRKNP